ncbi:head-tail adaptor protein [Qingshengfaniella alkalisoli]|nr:head-tail adaptor protein [Qingshengfaniella alkalisoli]
MQAGQLTDRVIFERRTQVSDGAGGYVNDWVEVTTTLAKVERISGVSQEVERMNAGGLIAAPPVRVHLRATASTREIATKDRARNLTTGEMMDVQSIQPGSRRRLVLTCLLTEVV